MTVTTTADDSGTSAATWTRVGKLGRSAGAGGNATSVALARASAAIASVDLVTALAGWLALSCLRPAGGGSVDGVGARRRACTGDLLSGSPPILGDAAAVGGTLSVDLSAADGRPVQLNGKLSGSRASGSPVRWTPAVKIAAPACALCALGPRGCLVTR